MSARPCLPARLTLRLLLLSSLIAMASVFADSTLQPVRLQLKWQHQFQFAGYYAAIEKGFYAEAGFDTQLIEYSGGTDLFEPVISGDVEFGLADASIVVKRLQGNPVVVLSTIFQHSPLVLISLKGSGILSPYELIGKRVMFQLGADDAAIQAMLTTLGVRQFEYQLVPHNFDNFALIHEETPVDVMSAYLSNQPFLYQEKGFDVQVISPANYGIDFYGDLLYSNEQYVKDNPDRVQAFRDASLQGWQYALAHKEEVIGWLQDKYPSHKSEAALRFEANIIEQMVAPNFVALGSLNPARFERIADIYKQLNLAPDNADLSGLVLSDYLRSESEANQRLLQVIASVALGLTVALAVLIIVLRSLRLTVKRRTAELNQANQALSHQLELTDRYVISAVVDREGHFLQASSALAEVSGYSQDELATMTSHQLVAPHMLDKRQAILDQVFQGESWQGELQYRNKDGRDFWVFLYIDPMQDAHGEITGYRSTATDITEKKVIQRMSETDGLTGIANRAKLDKVLSVEWARFERYGKALSVIIFDLDHFKTINDDHGHLAGDRVLIRVAQVVETLLRKMDVLGRWGGEEFMVILPETHLEAAGQVAEKMRLAIAQIEEHELPSVTASFGVAGCNETVNHSERLILLADSALYKAKENGRNQVVLAS
ncbi:diguanylate cyclase [Reinekea sp. G2M2-21]|uniref:diguanylate cyclase n=1 Tax=Reinekea sp. G2M2-21 TaxID=2788942 RepID=UPI0018A9D982|nr:diguanylate cyclase [Reinekea sp. G2M2-21]